jgi:hypothetical protein
MDHIIRINQKLMQLCSSISPKAFEYNLWFAQTHNASGSPQNLQLRTFNIDLY